MSSIFLADWARTSAIPALDRERVLGGIFRMYLLDRESEIRNKKCDGVKVTFCVRSKCRGAKVVKEVGKKSASPPIYMIITYSLQHDIKLPVPCDAYKFAPRFITVLFSRVSIKKGCAFLHRDSGDWL
jgi:hypothetical protein